jgi:hypothetical protein
MFSVTVLAVYRLPCFNTRIRAPSYFSISCTKTFRLNYNFQARVSDVWQDTGDRGEIWNSERRIKSEEADD